jgi:endonuclease/exonuclease/phosphatase family metal-dependent hydrolase
MATLKLLIWNMEWMNDLFDEKGHFHPDKHKPAHAQSTTVRTRRNHLSGVINDLQPDIVVVVEGPNRESELKLFFDLDVTGTWDVKLQPSPGSSQCIGCAIRTDTGKFHAGSPIRFFDTQQMPIFQPFELPNENDGIIEKYRFERLPLYVELQTSGQQVFRIMGLHLKSKGIFDAYEWSKWWAVADANRKKLIAQATQIRVGFLDKYLSEPATRLVPLIVCGDINDGPGMDASEKRLLGSAIERLMGNIWRPFLCLGNALFDTLSPQDQNSLRFDKIYTTTYKDPIFNNVWHKEWIDHVLYSMNRADWVSNAQVSTEMPDGQKIWDKYKAASDHLPVSVSITLQ